MMLTESEGTMERKHTPGPWEYVPSTEHHGPYICSEFGATIADFYVMSQPGELSTASGGASKPVLFLHEMADPNARLAAAAPALLEAAVAVVNRWDTPLWKDVEPTARVIAQLRAAIAKATT